MFQLNLMTIETGDALMFDAPGSGKNPVSIGFGVTIPWSSLKNSSKVREAQQNHEVLTASKRTLEDETKISLRKVYFRSKTLTGLLNSMKTHSFHKPRLLLKLLKRGIKKVQKALQASLKPKAFG